MSNKQKSRLLGAFGVDFWGLVWKNVEFMDQGILWLQGEAVWKTLMGHCPFLWPERPCLLQPRNITPFGWAGSWKAVSAGWKHGHQSFHIQLDWFSISLHVEPHWESLQLKEGWKLAETHCHTDIHKFWPGGVTRAEHSCVMWNSTHSSAALSFVRLENGVKVTMKGLNSRFHTSCNHATFGTFHDSSNVRVCGTAPWGPNWRILKMLVREWSDLQQRQGDGVTVRLLLLVVVIPTMDVMGLRERPRVKSLGFPLH